MKYINTEKYIDAEKLIAEIERLLKCTELHRGEDVADGSRQTLYWIKDFITSLQQEQPDNEDIDKVAQELYEHLYELKRRNNVPTNLYDKQEIIDLWKAGLEYGRSHPKQEHFADADKMEKVDFEKEIQEHLKECLDVKFPTTDIELIKKDVAYTARKFYELGINARKDE